MEKSLIHLSTAFDASFEWFAKKITLENFPELTDEAQDLFGKAKELLLPQSVHFQADINSYREENDGTSTVDIESIYFNGKVLNRLDTVHRVFPYVATCGTGFEDLDLSSYDFLAPYWVDILKTKALNLGMAQLTRHVRDTYRLGRINSLNPGSGNVDIWPIEENRGLFSMLGIERVKETCGVELTESCLMTPNKTVSGFFFDKDHVYESCAYCDREHCPTRRVPYQETL